MNASLNTRWAMRYATVVGAMDFLTGIALLIAPALTLDAMGASEPGDAAVIFVRFVGVFVGCVGAAYLHGVLSRGSEFWTMLRLTRLFRFAAGAFTGAAVLTRHLEPAWLAVTVTDLGCFAVQTWLLSREASHEG